MMMSKGGLFKGEHHNRDGNNEHGIPVQTPGGPIEVESQEVIITKPAVLDTKKVEFNGKQMTNCEVLSEINQSGGGVEIPCDDAPTAHQKGAKGELVGKEKGGVASTVEFNTENRSVCQKCSRSGGCEHTDETVKKLLKGVYRADQCTDINDAEQAFKSINYIINTYGQTPALERRWWSLRRSIQHHQKSKKAKGGVADADIRKSSRYVEVKLSAINTDNARFQNREHLNEKKLKYIEQHWSNNELDPLILWREPRTNKIFVLAGHHRRQAAINRGEQYIDAKFFDGAESEAIDYAINKSNTNRTLENASDRAKIYRKMRENGINEEDILIAADVEGLNKNRTFDFSFLNPTGKTMAALRNFEDSSSTDSSDNINQLAQWVGNARHLFPELTNAHEDEMYTYLLKNLTDKKVKSKAEFADLIGRRINGATKFNHNLPLNLENRIGKGVLETEKFTEINKQKAIKRELEKVIENIQVTVVDKKFRDKRIEETICELLKIEQKIGDLEREQSKAAVADTNQFSIFDEIDAKIEQQAKKEKEDALQSLEKAASIGDEKSIDALKALKELELFAKGGKTKKHTTPFITDVATIKNHIDVTDANIEAQLSIAQSPELLTISSKHDVPLSHIRNQFKAGLSVETEHTENLAVARVIALQHLDEMPNYYTELAKIEGGVEKKEDGGKVTPSSPKINKHAAERLERESKGILADIKGGRDVSATLSGYGYIYTSDHEMAKAWFKKEKGIDLDKLSKEIAGQKYAPSNSYVREVAKEEQSEKILTETDSCFIMDDEWRTKIWKSDVPVTDLVSPGDHIKSNYFDHEYIVYEVSKHEQYGHDVWSLVLYDVDEEGRRNKQGKFPSNFNFSYMNDYIVKNGKIRHSFDANSDEITIVNHAKSFNIESFLDKTGTPSVNEKLSELNELGASFQGGLVLIVPAGENYVVNYGAFGTSDVVNKFIQGESIYGGGFNYYGTYALVNKKDLQKLKDALKNKDYSYIQTDSEFKVIEKHNNGKTQNSEQENIYDAINALRILADDGDDSASDAIAALELLIEEKPLSKHYHFVLDEIKEFHKDRAVYDKSMDEDVEEFVYMKLSGDRNKEMRQGIMQALTGDVVSKADSGINKLIPVIQNALK